MSLVYAYIKLLDATSSVKEGEMVTAKNAKGIPDDVANAYNSAIKGTFLSQDSRKRFLQAAEEAGLAHLQHQKSIDDRFTNIAQQTGQRADLVTDPEHGKFMRYLELKRKKQGK